jgi:hypothetical protein
MHTLVCHSILIDAARVVSRNTERLKVYAVRRRTSGGADPTIKRWRANASRCRAHSGGGARGESNTRAAKPTLGTRATAGARAERERSRRSATTETRAAVPLGTARRSRRRELKNHRRGHARNVNGVAMRRGDGRRVHEAGGRWTERALLASAPPAALNPTA